MYIFIVQAGGVNLRTITVKRWHHRSRVWNAWTTPTHLSLAAHALLLDNGGGRRPPISPLLRARCCPTTVARRCIPIRSSRHSTAILPYDVILPDVLHWLLRLFDALLKALVKEVALVGGGKCPSCYRKCAKAQCTCDCHVDALRAITTEAARCGVVLEFWTTRADSADGSGAPQRSEHSGMLWWTSLQGVDKDKVLRGFDVAKVLAEPRASAVRAQWDRIVRINSVLPSHDDVTDADTAALSLPSPSLRVRADAHTSWCAQWLSTRVALVRITRPSADTPVLRTPHRFVWSPIHVSVFFPSSCSGRVFLAAVGPFSCPRRRAAPHSSALLDAVISRHQSRIQSTARCTAPIGSPRCCRFAREQFGSFKYVCSAAIVAPVAAPSSRHRPIRRGGKRIP